jgi:hypothetical protein
MTLNDTEMPLHIEKTEKLTTAIPCDYVDVAVSEDDQPRVTLRPHQADGSPVGSPIVLELEGIRALSAKLTHLLVD